MEKIYGYKNKDIFELIEFLKTKNENETLTNIFAEFALLTGKSKGTIRNMYYALVKKANDDKEFSKRHLGDLKLQAQKITEFNIEEEKSLIKKILIEQKKGRSARSVILELANYDGKIALRYQNKYRNVLKNKPQTIAEIVKEIREENGSSYDPLEVKQVKTLIPEMHLRRLQEEINNLMERTTKKLRQENEYLKARLNDIEIENIKLKNIFFGENKTNKPIEYFKSNQSKKILN